MCKIVLSYHLALISLAFSVDNFFSLRKVERHLKSMSKKSVIYVQNVITSSQRTSRT